MDEPLNGKVGMQPREWRMMGWGGLGGGVELLFLWDYCSGTDGLHFEDVEIIIKEMGRLRTPMLTLVLIR